MRIRLWITTLLVVLLAACSSLDKAQQLYQQGELQDALEMAAGYLGSDDPEERIRALKILGRVGSDKAAQLIFQHLEDPHLEVQRVAIQQTGLLSYAPASKTLVKLALTIHPELARDLAECIRKVGTPAIEALVDHYSQNSGHQKQLKPILIQIGPDISGALTRSLKGNSFFENRERFDILVELKSPQVATAMLDYIGNDELAPSVIEGLSKLGTTAVDPIMNYLQQPKQQELSARIIERLVKTLGNLGSERATHLLEDLSTHPSELVRAAVDHSLFQIRGY